MNMSETKKVIGKVKWYNEGKGYGFLSSEDYSDIFVHYSAIEGSGYKTLKEDEIVEVEVVDGPKGPQAVSVKKKTD
jgi:CspA family cold shock protein